MKVTGPLQYTNGQHPLQLAVLRMVPMDSCLEVLVLVYIPLYPLTTTSWEAVGSLSTSASGCLETAVLVGCAIIMSIEAVWLLSFDSKQASYADPSTYKVSFLLSNVNNRNCPLYIIHVPRNAFIFH